MGFYDLKADLPGGKVYDFADLKGKVVLIVNVASQWWVAWMHSSSVIPTNDISSGFTPQYKGTRLAHISTTAPWYLHRSARAVWQVQGQGFCHSRFPLQSGMPHSAFVHGVRHTVSSLVDKNLATMLLSASSARLTTALHFRSWRNPTSMVTAPTRFSSGWRTRNRDFWGSLGSRYFLLRSSGYQSLIDQQWNFEKFLIDKNGNVTNRWASTTTPAAIDAEVAKLVAAWWSSFILSRPQGLMNV
jgi:peroxiredoxin